MQTLSPPAADAAVPTGWAGWGTGAGRTSWWPCWRWSSPPSRCSSATAAVTATRPPAADAPVALSEFALTPAAVTVPAGGSLKVTNDGTMAHNLSIEGTDLKTADLAGARARRSTCPPSSPASTRSSAIPGHADAGMTGTLTIGGGRGAGLDQHGCQLAATPSRARRYTR